MRLVTWNIRFGGRKKRPEIVEALLREQPDVIALSEYMPAADSTGVALQEMLAAAGYDFQVGPSEIVDGEYGALLASRWPVAACSNAPDEFAHRWAHGRIAAPSGEVEVAAVYIPTGAGDATRKRGMLDWLLQQSAQLQKGGPIVITGDFNCDHLDDTGARNRLVGEPRFQRLFENEWRDLYRELHPPGTAVSWWTPAKTAFRLDHVLAGPLGPAVVDVRYLTADALGPFVQTPNQPSTRRLSDHAMVVTDLAI